ncbi:hypothetical protein [Streptomyces sp. NPDC058632]|uniref:hypothetical protein n=1 Tax=unclassified Streptomyces TaxID=2593676 RepID=UPI0036464926
MKGLRLSVKGLRAEYGRLRGEGVAFVQEPRGQGPVLTAVLDDTVGDPVRLARPEEDRASRPGTVRPAATAGRQRASGVTAPGGPLPAGSA